MLNNILQFLKERELYSQANFETELDNHLKEKKITFMLVLIQLLILYILAIMF
ncbi:hypothetical protein [Mycoplasmoides genitalium]|uniref:hypothetical protein n=1 Tax=Mycoplasmoides genitalium TaxID=2097 RepID=UPI00031509FB|nr:hypothetical protein [Mycoplasmoides genitalium]